jgi:hypothetical protein
MINMVALNVTFVPMELMLMWLVLLIVYYAHRAIFVRILEWHLVHVHQTELEDKQFALRNKNKD